MGGGGSLNRPCAAGLAHPRSMTAVGLLRSLAAKSSNRPFRSAEPRTVMAFGGVAVRLSGGLVGDLSATVPVLIIQAIVAPGIDAAGAPHKPRMGCWIRWSSAQSMPGDSLSQAWRSRAQAACRGPTLTSALGLAPAGRVAASSCASGIVSRIGANR